MKKLLVFLVVAALLLSLTVAGFTAEVKPGNEVTVTFTLNNTNAAYVRVVASYDKTVFDLVGYTAVSGQAGSSGIVVYDTKPLSSGEVGTVTLKVKEDAKPGTYTISGELAECYDLDENDGKATVSGSTTVTIADKATPTPKPTEKPTPKPTEKPTPKPTEKPATEPPVVEPTEAPVVEPTVAPTEEPTAEPVVEPTVAPTEEPIVEPTAEPVVEPTITPTEKPTDEPVVEPTAEPEKKIRYHQSVCSLGLRFRDVKPEITSKWFMFTPVDLSEDGVQEIDLIAANISYVGKVTVQVSNGTVKVIDHVWPAEKNSLTFALLPDLDSVTTADIKEMKTYDFNQEINIADELDGDTNVLLYVFGYVNYDFAQNEVFVGNGASYQNLVDKLESLMD